MSNPKVKGFLKGLRYISQIFDEEKEPEIQIGNPTDVKHVAHIGSNGPSLETPSWMKEFKPPTHQSAPLSAQGLLKENPEGKDESEKQRRRRHHSSENVLLTSESPQKESSSSSSSRSRNSRRQKNSSQKEDDLEPRSPSRSLPGIPKKTRRKKSKDSESGRVEGSSRRSRSKCSSGGSSTNELDQAESTKPVVQEHEKESKN